MAGSYEHVLHGWSLIENMGDAYEAVEELLWLVQSEIGEEKAISLLKTKLYPMKRRDVARDKHYLDVQELMGK